MRSRFTMAERCTRKKAPWGFPLDRPASETGVARTLDSGGRVVILNARGTRSIPHEAVQPVKSCSVSLIAIICLCNMAAPPRLQAQEQEHPIRFSAKLQGERAAVRPGDTLSIIVRGHIPPGWHLYSITQAPGGPIATTIEVGPRDLVRLAGAIDAPVPQMVPDPN